VVQIIKAPNFDNFTTSDVRSSYITLKNDPSLDPIIVRRRLYAELLKLVKKGWLKKKNVNKKGATRFGKTKLFDPEYLDALQENKPKAKVFKEDKQKNLITKLNHYKAELLLNIGESEAYKELYSEFPELVDELQPQYNKARDNNTRILGKIRAIEGLLNQDEPLEKI
jgi:site-specific DNA-adenine methylase